VSVVLDASAVLAFSQGEPGADPVEAVLDGAVVGAPNWAEVLTKTAQVGADPDTVGSLLKALGVRIEAIAEDDARLAAALAAANPSLSLGDRFCLAVAERLGRPAYTADQAWRRAATTAEVVLIR
jgi:PIN domain nuclease of toxin-antitoxin system